MADTPKPGETVIPGDTQTPVTTVPTPAPTQDTGNAAEVEQLRKEREQRDLRIRQLENEAAARKTADEEAERKRLEENQEWKSLAEQEKAKREAIEAEREEAARTASLTNATTEVLSQYNEQVVEIAKATGLTVSSDDEAGKAAFKEKLDKIASNVTGTSKPSPNNPNTPTGATQDELMQRIKAGDRTARTEAIANLEGVKAMRQMSGYGS
jgi:hypothetical protein